MRMLRHLAVFLAFLVVFCPICRAEFSFSATEPDFEVQIPSLPSIPLGAHPMRTSDKPHLRYFGSDGNYTVSVITPTADAGMTAAQCASATLRSLNARPGVPSQEKIYRARLSETTYVAIYASPIDNAVQLHAHLLSAATGTHCIEVHVSKASTSKEDVAPWVQGFASARIKAREHP